MSLSPEKIPPHYAFPDLKHTLIPVEDFTGPTIAEIQKFLEICDCARRDGEVGQKYFFKFLSKYFWIIQIFSSLKYFQAVGVHCAEGRGRTGVMCACYLIYYYDMEPWDAIRYWRQLYQKVTARNEDFRKFRNDLRIHYGGGEKLCSYFWDKQHPKLKVLLCSFSVLGGLFDIGSSASI